VSGTAGDHAGEGSPPAPDAAVLRRFFGERAPVALAFAHHLGTTALVHGLLGPRELPRLWTRHILNCAAIGPLVPPAARVADVGSGAGLPGLVLAIARPDVEVTLVEPLLRRVAWLEEVTKDLDLANVVVVRARAEELPTEWADIATARAVAPLAKLTAWCLPLVKPGGLMLAIKGRSAAEELRESSSLLPALGAVSWGVREIGGDLLEEPTTVVEVRKGTERRSGRRASRPAAGRRR
jgi:16S rRNA (guanine527-N7)-methyltransferase